MAHHAGSLSCACAQVVTGSTWRGEGWRQDPIMDSVSPLCSICSVLVLHYISASPCMNLLRNPSRARWSCRTDTSRLVYAARLLLLVLCADVCCNTIDPWGRDNTLREGAACGGFQAGSPLHAVWVSDVDAVEKPFKERQITEGDQWLPSCFRQELRGLYYTENVILQSWRPGRTVQCRN